VEVVYKTANHCWQEEEVNSWQRSGWQDVCCSAGRGLHQHCQASGGKGTGKECKSSTDWDWERQVKKICFSPCLRKNCF